MHAPVAVDESRLLRSIPAARVALIERIARACGGGGRNELPQRSVHLIVHPVLQSRRDRRGHLVDIGANGAQAAHPESWQLYEIDRVSDPAQIERLQRDLEVTLADVRFAVTDWTAMRERVRE